MLKYMMLPEGLGNEHQLALSEAKFALGHHRQGMNRYGWLIQGRKEMVKVVARHRRPSGEDIVSTSRRRTQHKVSERFVRRLGGRKQLGFDRFSRPKIESLFLRRHCNILSLVCTLYIHPSQLAIPVLVPRLGNRVEI